MLYPLIGVPQRLTVVGIPLAFYGFEEKEEEHVAFLLVERELREHHTADLSGEAFVHPEKSSFCARQPLLVAQMLELTTHRDLIDRVAALAPEAVGRFGTVRAQDLGRLVHALPAPGAEDRLEHALVRS